MRLAATLALLNPFTGSTPGRLFQRPTKRSVGQPAISSASSFWLAKVSNGGGSRGGSLFCGAERRDVVIAVDRKRRHNLAPWGHALRGHDMDHSEAIERQGNCAGNRRWRTGWR